MLLVPRLAGLAGLALVTLMAGAANPAVGFVIDDVLPPWQPRAVQVRGTAEALDTATWPDGTHRGAIIRITPTKVISCVLEQE